MTAPGAPGTLPARQRPGLWPAGPAPGLCGAAAVRAAAQPLRARLRHAAGHTGGHAAGGRLFDAATDPLLGRLSDRLFGRSTRTVLGAGAVRPWCWRWGMGRCSSRPCRASRPWPGGRCCACWPPTWPTASSALPTSRGARLGGDEAPAAASWPGGEGAAPVGVVLASLLPTFCWACPPCWACLPPRWCWAGGPGPAAPRPAAQGADMHGVYHPAQHASLWRPWGARLPPPAGGVHARHCQRHPGQCWCCSSFKTAYRRHPRRNRCSWAPTSSAQPCRYRCGCAPWSRFGPARTWLMGMLLAVAVFA